MDNARAVLRDDTYEFYQQRCEKLGIQPRSFNTWLKFQMELMDERFATKSIPARLEEVTAQ